MRSLAEHLGVAVNSVTSLIDHLEKKGLVHRTRSDVDRRVINVELTESGLKAFEIVSDAKLQFHRALLSALTEDEQEIMLVLFRKIARKGGNKSKSTLHKFCRSQRYKQLHRNNFALSIHLPNSTSHEASSHRTRNCRRNVTNYRSFTTGQFERSGMDACNASRNTLVTRQASMDEHVDDCGIDCSRLWWWLVLGPIAFRIKVKGWNCRIPWPPPTTLVSK